MIVQYIIDSIHDELQSHGITRSDQEIEHALDGAISALQERLPWTITHPDDVFDHGPTWHELMHAPSGILDLLEIDSEDTLYDRL